LFVCVVVCELFTLFELTFRQLFVCVIVCELFTTTV
jgi:hypothetical protein